MPHRTGAPDRSPERLVRDYADLVLRVCYTYLRTTADAEDVCQDTLLKLICREEPFNGPDHERAWVIRVASNACKNLLRSRGAHPEVGLSSAPEPEAAPEPDEEALARRDERGTRSRDDAASAAARGGLPPLLRGLPHTRDRANRRRLRRRRAPAPEPRPRDPKR